VNPLNPLSQHASGVKLSGPLTQEQTRCALPRPVQAAALPDSSCTLAPADYNSEALIAFRIPTFWPGT